MSGDCIIIPSGPNKSIWCRTQAAYETIARPAQPEGAPATSGEG